MLFPLAMGATPLSVVSITTQTLSIIIIRFLLLPGEKIPGVYGRVSSVVDWIYHHTADGQSCRKPSSARESEEKIDEGLSLIHI